MAMIKEQREKDDLNSLTPDTVLTLAERSLGKRCTNLFRPLNSYINRVYELETESGDPLIIKFYRPGRWSKEALEDEHRFLVELKDAELPVIAPLVLEDGKTMGFHNNMLFTVFPKFGGRSTSEFSFDQWAEIGRLLARVHNGGEIFSGPHRAELHPEKTTRIQQQYLLESGLIPAAMVKEFTSVTNDLIELISPEMSKQKMHYIHGDCHFSNILHRPGEAFYLIDFDDMVLGPAVQDVWMLLPDVASKSAAELEMFLEGYETFRSFDVRTLQLIEPLRAMRYIHYMAWCAYQAVEDGNVHVMENFGDFQYWRVEINDLYDQLKTIEKEVV